MMKRYFVLAAVAAAFLMVCLSCQRDEIHYPVSNYYVGIDVNPNPLEKDFVLPNIYSANFYDVATGSLAYSTYVRSEYHPMGLPAGGYVTGLTPGEYDVLVYNFDLRRSSVIDRHVYGGAYAESEIFGRSNDVAVTYTPDNLYVYSDRIKVPYITESDGVFIIEAKLDDVVESWTVRVDGVKNAELAEKITFYISGQSIGKYLSNAQKLKERSIIQFPGRAEEVVFPAGYESVERARTKAEGDSTGFVVTGDYTTYGALENVERILLTVHIVGPNGSNYFGQMDVTDEVRNPENKDHIITTTFDVEIKEREDGGFQPAANPWRPDSTKIVLQ